MFFWFVFVCSLSLSCLRLFEFLGGLGSSWSNSGGHLKPWILRWKRSAAITSRVGVKDEMNPQNVSKHGKRNLFFGVSQGDSTIFVALRCVLFLGIWKVKTYWRYTHFQLPLTTGGRVMIWDIPQRVMGSWEILSFSTSSTTLFLFASATVKMFGVWNIGLHLGMKHSTSWDVVHPCIYYVCHIIYHIL